MDINKITNVLIFKDGYYYLTIPVEFSGAGTKWEGLNCYKIIPKENFTEFGIDRNGFEFASDAYAYIVSLQPPSPVVEYDKEEERLKEMGEV